jgi:putative flavoprotein involved in K+ transport
MTAETRIDAWLAAFDAALTRGDAATGAALFHADATWRDLLSFTWNIVTAEGADRIAALLRECVGATRPAGWQRSGPATAEDDGGVSAWFTFGTAAASCSGRLTLRGDRASGLFTQIEDLTGHEEARGAHRPLGATHRADRDRPNWAELRDRRRARLGREDQPHVLIIGGGQGGLALAARLKALGVPALVVERNPRVGDSWRNRYRSLVLHDPVWYDHMPYIRFPETWPVFTPKDQMGDWLEAYALALDLDVWTSSTVETARWTGTGWEVTVTRPGGQATLRPVELVFATGAYGPPRAIDWPGAAGFGGTLIHSSAYQDGQAWAGRRAVVVGAASSAHDVAVDLWEAGAEVTLIQRSATCVVRSDTLMEMGFGLYSEAANSRGIDVDRADRIAAAVPYARFTDSQRTLYAAIRARDAAFYDRLAARGFLLDFGPDDSGLMMKALRTASGYYIDVGASELIADGRIGLVAGQGVAAVDRDGLVLDDGRHVAADLVVACTGYQSMHRSVAAIVSEAAAEAVGTCWGLGSGVPGDPGPWQGELRNMWKPTAIRNLWFHGGNLALSRFHSRHVALQIKARKEGIATPVWGGPVQRGA